MKPIKSIIVLMALLLTILLQGCATSRQSDYDAFKKSNPRSILVLPPLNKSPDVRASNSVLAQVTRPLAESGFYVLPVSLVSETFKENGLTQPAEIHATPIQKLHDIFGADAVLYITVNKFGPTYTILNSQTEVVLQGKLVDLKSGATLWEDSARASSAEKEGQQQSTGGLAGQLIGAIFKQVVASIYDEGHQYAGIAATRLLSAGRRNGILFGPRSPYYGKDNERQASAK